MSIFLSVHAFPSLFLPHVQWQADLTSGPSAFKRMKEEKAKEGGGGCSRDQWGVEGWGGCPCWGCSPVLELRDKVGNFYLALPITPCWSCACFRLDTESSPHKQHFFLSFSFPLWALKDNQPPLFSEGAAMRESICPTSVSLTWGGGGVIQPCLDDLETNLMAFRASRCLLKAPISKTCHPSDLSPLSAPRPHFQSCTCFHQVAGPSRYLSGRTWGRELGGTWFDPQHVCPLEAADKEVAEVSVFLRTHCYNDRQWQGGAMAQTQKENEWPQIRSNMPLAQTHRRKRKKTKQETAFCSWVMKWK